MPFPTESELEYAIVPVMAELRRNGLLLDTAARQDVLDVAQREAVEAGTAARDLSGEPETTA